MGLGNLEYFFKPSGIAVVGASEREGTVGAAVMRNLVGGSYQGLIAPVNPRRSEVFGIKAFPEISRVNAKVDLAVIAIPIEDVPDAVDECGKIGVKGAVILSAGGRETGQQGLALEKEILTRAAPYGMRIIGPNCLGVICSESGLNASFASSMPPSGRLAFISQSGAICTAILDLAMEEKIGFSHFISVGSMLDVDFGDLVDYLGNEIKVNSILVYMEGLTNIRKFMSAARSVSQLKPIVVLKAGRSEEGALAASSHTGSMAGEDILYDAAFERAGIVRVKEIGELFDCAELLSKQPRPVGPKLAVITNAGGPGVMAADAIHDAGLELTKLSDELMGKLDEVLPRCWSRRNPIDILGDATPERYVNVINTCISAFEVNGVLVILTPQAMTDPTAVAQSIAKSVVRRPMPVLTCWMGGKDVSEGRGLLNKAGIPTYETPERAVKAFRYLYDYAKKLEALQQIPSKFPKSLQFKKEKVDSLLQDHITKGDIALGELETMKVLEAYGFPVNRIELAKDVKEALEIWRTFDGPVAMKVCSPEIIHKTEAGGVKLNIHREEEVLEAYNTILENSKRYNPDASIKGVTLQPMVASGDYEILVGARKDPLFGPAVVFGWGGIYTEFFKDIATGFPPLNRNLARLMIEKTRVSKLLKGYRNKPPADLDLLEEILLRLANLVTDFAEIAELDMNPIVIKNGRPVIVDARMIVKPSKVPSPEHLIISPYPNQYEWHLETSKGVKIFVRPVRPEDAPLFVELFNVLSPTTVYLRFFRPMKALPHSMLVRFTQVDYDREVALVALEEDGLSERMLGVARIITGLDKEESEFAVLVGDPWQGRGIGAALLTKCLIVAKEQKIKRVKGIVLPENTQMLALGRKLGFAMGRSSEGGECELSINLETLSVEDLIKQKE